MKACNDKNILSPLSCKDTNKNYNPLKIKGLVTVQSKQVCSFMQKQREEIQNCQLYILLQPQTTLADEKIVVITKIVKGNA